MAHSLAVNNRSIVLVGMMGAGKTTVGKALAARLGRPFIDLDEEVEREVGRSISDIFDEEGEAAFRLLERRAMARLLGHSGLVIATGGGAFIDDETRAAVLERCIAIWLRADFETLTRRLRQSYRRPLLRGSNQEKRLRDLAAERNSIYAEAPLHVVSDEQAVERILEALEQQR